MDEKDCPKSDHDLLLRIDERVNAIHEKLPDLVTRSEFVPVKALTFGAAGMICVAAFAALISLVIPK